MNPNYREFRFPSIRAHPWAKILRPGAPAEAVSLVSKLLEYNPEGRLTPLQACAHPFFDELRNPATKLTNNHELPPLFNFTEAEMSIEPALNNVLIPSHQRQPNSEAELRSTTGSAADEQPTSEAGQHSS